MYNQAISRPAFNAGMPKVLWNGIKIVITAKAIDDIAR